MKTMLKRGVVGAAALAIAGSMLAIGAGSASAVTPPFEPDLGAVGSLNFYNSAGTQVFGGNLNDQPLAAYVQGSAQIAAGDVKATLFAYAPKAGVNPGAWAGEQIGLSTTYPNPAAPGALGTSPLPLNTGTTGDESLATAFNDFPNTDTSSDGYAGLYELRLKTSGGTNGTSIKYERTDIQFNNVTTDASGAVTGGTWTVVYPAPPVIPAVSAITASPVSPAAHGSTVTLSATVTEGDGSALPSGGGVELFDGTTDKGAATFSATTGAASKTDTPADGDHSYTFKYTNGSASATSPALAYHVNANIPTPTVALAVGGANTTAGSDATLTATVTPTTAAGSVAFYDNGSTTPLPGTVTTPSAGTYALDLPTGFAAGNHSVVAKFTPTSPTAFNPAASPAQAFLTQGAVTPVCQAAGSVCTDVQNIQATIPLGTLIINTPYTAAHPLDIGTLALQPGATEYSGNGSFSNIIVVDTRAGDLPYTVTALSSDLSNGGSNTGSTIDSQNVGLTGLTPAGSGGFNSPVHIVENPAANPPALAGAAAGAAGQQGLGLTPHTIVTVDHGIGTLTMNGTLTITAPTSTEAGLFTGTITFTVGG